MLFSFFWRYVLLNFIAKKYYPYLIVVVDGAESKYGPHFSDQFFFSLVYGTKEGTGAHINQQYYREFTLFFKNFCKGVRKPGAHIPVNKAYIISVRIFPYLPET